MTRFVLLAAAAGLAAPSSASAASDRAAVTFDRLGAAGAVLHGGVSTREIDLALPARWRAAAGELLLRYEGSPLLAAGSLLELSVNGTPRSAAYLSPGPGTLAIRLPSTSAPGEMRLVLTGRLKLRGDSCLPPGAAGAFVVLSGSSLVTLTGSPRPGPVSLADLPRVLDRGVGPVGPPITVVFATRPTPSAVAAAALAVGEVARATGTQPANVQVSLPGSAVSPAPGGVRMILTERPGPATIRISTRASGGIDLGLAGSSADLLDAAAALTPDTARTLSGSEATTLPHFTAAGAAQLVPSTIAVSAATADGTGSITATATFRVPEWLELDRGARLQARVGYVTPLGGSLAIAVNGIPGTQRKLLATGPAQFSIDQLLAGSGPTSLRGDVLVGANSLTVAANVAPRANGACLPVADPGSVSVLPGGTLRVRAHRRGLTPGLVYWPFPLSARTGGRGATFVLPAQPGPGELAATLETLAEVARWTNEPVAPEIAFGRLPAGNVVVLARPEGVPPALAAGLGRPPATGLLASFVQSNRLVTLAVGIRALNPLRVDAFPGKLDSTLAMVDSGGGLHILKGGDESAVQTGGLPWRWPVAIIVVGGFALIAGGLQSAVRAARLRRTPTVEPTVSPGDTVGSTPVGDRIEDWRARHRKEPG